MSSYMDLMKYAQPDSSAAQQGGAQPAAQVAAQQPSPSYGGLDKYAPDPSSLQNVVAAQGAAPETAIDESPLSIAQRAMLGWARSPQEQEKYLRQEFDDVKTVDNGDGMGFAVKKGGKWFQADPAFHWEYNLPAGGAGAALGAFGGGPVGAAIGAGAGFIPSMLNGKNLKDLPGDVAQFIGEYGLRAVGAAAATAAVVGTAPVSIPTIIAGTAAAGLGAAGADAVDLGTRAATMDPNAPGARPYKSADDVMKQLNLSAIYGMQQELGGKAGEAVLGKAADTIGNIIKQVSNTPEGRTTVRKLFGMLGADDMTTEARLMNPARNAKFDEIAARDSLSPLDVSNHQLPKIEDNVFNQINDQIQGAVQKEGTEFAKLKADPKVRNAAIDSSGSYNDAIQLLKDNGLVTQGGEVNRTRAYGDGDVEAIQRILRGSKNAQQLTYDQARALTQDLNTVMKKGIGNDSVMAAAARLKAGIHQDIVNGIGDEAGQQYAAVLNKYATAKGLAKDFENMSDGAQKKASFVSKLMSPEGKRTAAKDMVKDLVNVGVNEDSINQLLQIQGSRQAQHWFEKARILGTEVPLPTGPKGQAALITKAAAAKQAVTENPAVQAMLPYADKVMRQLRTIDPAQRANLLKNPQAIDAMSQLIQGGAVGEQQQAQQLLQQSGVVPPGGGQQ